MGCITENVIQKNLYDRVSQLLESFEWSDCSFSVSGKTFKAHKLLLGISSPVFKAMFYGPLSTDTDIVICDIQPSTFQRLLKYIYTDKIELESVGQALRLLYAAKKYMIEYLMKKCKRFIEENMCVDNVISVLNYTDFVQEKQLFTVAMILFCTHSDYFVEHGIENLSVYSLKAILECSQINTTEIRLIKTVFKWSINFCMEHGFPAIPENRRKVLVENGLLQLLRFLVLSHEELDSLILDDNLLLPEEIVFIKNNSDQDCVDMPSDAGALDLCNVKKQRQKPKYRWQFCHRSELRSAPPLKIHENCNKVVTRMRASKTVFLHALSMRTRSAPFSNWGSEGGLIPYTETFCIVITDESNKTLVKEINFVNKVQYDSFIFIDLDEPCLIKRDSWYKIIFIWPVSWDAHKYVVAHRHSICNHKVNFEFDDIMTECTDTYGSFMEGLKYSL